MMIEADAVILSACLSPDHFKVTNDCINSLVSSEPGIKFNLIIVENNKEWATSGYRYDYSDVRVLVPESAFNYNKFLNEGFSFAKSNTIIFSNNDVIFHPGWLTEILKVKAANEEILSFCPFDRTSPYLSIKDFSRRNFYLGYNVPVHFVGWCFVFDRGVFNAICKFDEQFDMYFQDNDLAATLKSKSILHALVPGSFVQHIGGFTTKTYDASKTGKYRQDKQKFIAKWGDISLSERILVWIKSLMRRI